MGSLSDPVCSDRENKLSADVACQELLQTLDRHYVKLQRRIQEQEEFAAKEAANIQRHQATCDEQEARKTHIWKQLDFLDTCDMEQIPQRQIRGQSAFHQERSMLSIRPSFKFDLTSSVPIRDWICQQSAGVKWDPIICVKGTTTLTSTAHARSFATSTAAIELLGWRKEIYADEISRLRGWLIEIESSISYHTSLIKESTDRIGAKAQEVEEVRQELGRYQRDFIALHRASAATSHANLFLPIKVHVQLEAGSLSGYAAATFNLGTEIDSPPEIASSLARAIEACKTELASAKTKMDEYAEAHDWVMSSETQSQLVLINALLRYAAVGHPPDFVPVSAALDKMLPASKGTEIALFKEECEREMSDLMHYAKQMNSDIKATFDGLGDGSIVSGEEARKRSAEMATAREALGRQIDTMDRVCGLVTARKQPLGVAAALQSPRYRGEGGLADAFFSIYTGERLLAGE
ncbi:hypothetical protein QBC47DRAFT_439167 [Echria macrotheca]|uniref:Uncharacterized protein n=1 Tax=Echria macrotheca TaxID=438768 RepID=A0AAJ0B2M5_9PEZI|nr:hypothetical protein QBC47DRAFT_439167 [Echria macrotheca]